ncbi:MAG: TonB family protein [Acidobacteria bacterium]|nr:TonB family protein [Acidobacteriota bacterium]NIM64318.1 TonB family protein [Acidobacteriota bacterium]NIQ84961.1 TonB family protein [Acidobacteriota bacterium]NIT10775.1 TonB family protein [Acidobacteriota bacterium]
MSKHQLKLDERIRAEDELFRAMAHHGENKLLATGFVVALFLHVAVLFIHFPDMNSLIPEKKQENVIQVTKYVPPPPKVKKREIVQQKLTRKVPIPDPTPDEPEPIREPEPEEDPEPIPADVEFIIGVPEPPPPTGPLLAGVNNVSNPVLIESTKIEPEYPELARVARLEGQVILQAIVRKDGTVGDISVIRVNRPNLGFEDSAIAAVKQWRYEPALQNGKPVEVYFTVVVDFSLH